MKKGILLFSLLFIALQFGFSQTWEGARIINGSVAYANLGTSVAVSGDYAVAGQPAFSSLTSSAVVYHLDGTKWQKVATLRASDGVDGDRFGTSVAFQNDVIVVGSPRSNAGASSSGSLYVFEMPVGGWQGEISETAKLTQANPANAYLGQSVAIDGDVIVAGAPYLLVSPIYNSSGAVFVFEKSGSHWSSMTQSAKLLNSSPSKGANLGWDVDIDGDIIVAGSPGYSSSKGRAFVFKRSGAYWTNMSSQTATLSAQYGLSNEKFGSSVSVDNNIIVIGSPKYSSYSGAFYVFEKTGTNWVTSSETQRTYGLSGYYLGADVKVLNEVLYVAATGYNSQGAVLRYTKPATGWGTNFSASDIEMIEHDSTDVSDNFGSSIAVDGDNLVIGSPNRSNGSLANAGGVCFFRPVATAPSVQASNVNTTRFGTSMDLSWTVGDGDNRAVFMKQELNVSSPNLLYLNNYYYLPDDFGAGSQIVDGSPTGWYCVYNGKADHATVQGLTPNTAYSIKVVEYNGIQGQEKYLNGSATGNPVNVKTGIDLSGVTLSVKDNMLYNTTADMAYSRNGEFGFYQVCSSPNTAISMGVVENAVYVREIGNQDNVYLVKDVKRRTQPSLTIDYVNEQVKESIPTDVEYSTSSDFSTTTAGTDNMLPLAPGEDIYFRRPATDDSLQSLTLTLSGPVREDVAYSIDYLAKSTIELVTSKVEYAEDASFTVNVQQGTDAVLPLTPGTDLWFRVYASDENQTYQGHTFSLTVPDAPAAPTNPMVDDDANTFDWTNNPSYANVSDYEYSVNSGATWTICTSKPIEVGNIDLSAGEVQVRVGASTDAGAERFSGYVLSSDAGFTSGTVTSAELVTEEPAVSVYPNPSASQIAVTAPSEILRVVICDTSGSIRKVVEKPEKTIELSDLPAGLYFIKIETLEGVTVSKVIKN